MFAHLNEIAASYRKLRDLSRIARYEADGLGTWTDYEDSAAAYEQIESHLNH